MENRYGGEKSKGTIIMRITTLLPSTGFERPTADELRELLRRVRSEYEWLPAIPEDRFARSMWATGFMYRTAEPDASVYFNAHVDSCCNLLAQYGHRDDCDGNSVFASIIAHADVTFRLANGKGQLLEAGLSRYTGAKCSNAWRGVLAGQPLLEPLPPKGIARRPADSISRPKFYEEGSDGIMREFSPAPLLMR
jgi:hypothetical protein